MNEKIPQKEEVLTCLKKYKKPMKEKYGVNKLGIFGSVARGEANNLSDVDIVLEMEQPHLFKMVHIKHELEELLCLKVDLIRYRKSMNPYLKKRIDRDACYV
jgi:uncharacterized protein